MAQRHSVLGACDFLLPALEVCSFNNNNNNNTTATTITTTTAYCSEGKTTTSASASGLQSCSLLGPILRSFIDWTDVST